MKHFRIIAIAGLILLCAQVAHALKAVDIVDRVGPSIVYIYAEDEWGYAWQGSGIIISEDGKILTNFHVAAGADYISVKRRNGDTFDVLEVLDYDEGLDLAVVKIDAQGLPPAVLGDSDAARVGEDVLAIGNPEGLEFTVSRGILSARRDLGDGYLVLQTDASIAHGSSGGALVNENAEVIGVTTYIFDTEGGADLNFAMPINYAAPFIESTGSMPLSDFAASTREYQEEQLEDTYSYIDENRSGEESGWPRFEGDSDRMFPGLSEEVEEQLMLEISRIDFNNNAVITWFTDELWALMAQQDQSMDALMGSRIMTLMSQDYYVFFVGAMEGPGVTVADATLETEDGAVVSSVPVHPSVLDEFEGLVAFPRLDARGRPLILDTTQKLIARVRYSHADEYKRYAWRLPLQYPQPVQEAMQWFHSAGMQDKPLSSMSDFEMVYQFVAPVMQVDLEYGFIVAPLSSDYFVAMMSGDPEVAADPELAEALDIMFSDYSFFLMIPMGSDDSAAWLTSLARGAEARDVYGRRVAQDYEAMAEFGMSAGGEDLMMLFPKLGNGGSVSLFLEDPETGRDIEFIWDM